MNRTRTHVLASRQPALTSLFTSLRHAACLRHLSLLLALCCFWSFAGAGIALAAAPQRNTLDQTKSVHHPFPHAPAFYPPTSAFGKAPLTFGTAPAPVFWATPVSTKPTTPLTQTRLDEVGRSQSRITTAEALTWKTELATHPAPKRAALLHIWLGEWQLGQNQEPATAQSHFRQAQRLLPYTDKLYGLAAYDSAIALFYEGAFTDAATAFSALLPKKLDPKTALRGYDRRRCSLWLRHAVLCAGYHEDHARLGVPEPTRLDPDCGIASLAACLRSLSLPYARATLRQACRVTGEGSTMADLMASGKTLGVSLHSVSADETGLKLLPKPLVAYVEHDHFVALVRADNAGVSYLCSDCGPWPGGRVNLTWKQWRALNPGVYAAVTKPGSLNDRLLSALPAPKTTEKASGLYAKDLNAPVQDSLAHNGLVQVSYSGGLKDLHLSERLHFAASLTALRGHVARWELDGWLGCGASMFCLPCYLQDVGLDPAPIQALGAQPAMAFGPKSGDPVNLATGEEEYNPPADLTVYNPSGPAVTWQRSYRSLRPSDTSYESDDFGIGWTQPYTMQVSDAGSTQTLPQIPQAAATQLGATGTDAPAAGLSWDILLNGSIVATSASTGGWTATFSGYGVPTLTPPTSSTVSTGYELRYNNTYTGNPASVLFDVVAAASVPQGKTSTFAPNGSGAPGTGLTWDILVRGRLFASSSASGGWTVVPSSNGSALTSFTVTAPPFANLGSYTVRGKVNLYPSGTATATAAFSVYAVHYIATTTGTKSVIMPNGAAISFMAPAVPTASTPRVQCSVQPGVPFLVEWDYASGVYGGYFTITYADRTQWITTGFTGQYGAGSNRCFLSQIVDRNGNYILMCYGGLGTYNLPLLSAIDNSFGIVLLSIGRSGNAITSVSDAYGRSVFYQGGGALTQVSQIVPTGTAVTSAPARYTYGYANVNNPEGLGFPFLHTITVPSPTGTGTSTATINYTNGTGTVSSTVDANGNTRTYAQVNQDGTPLGYGSSNYTGVTVTNAAGATVYSYVSGADNNMNETSRTDGRTDGSGHYTTYVSTKVFSDPNDPYRPSAVYDGNGSTAVPSGTGPFVPQGRTATFAPAGNTYLSGVSTWLVTLSGTTIASGASPNGWGVSYAGSNLTVGAPAGAAVGSGYQVQYNTNTVGGQQYGPYATFSILAAGTKPPTTFTWDSHGNMVSRTSPRGTTTTYTYSYTNFGLGELMQVQEGTNLSAPKAPTTYAYFEPSGLVQSMTAPLPGTTNSTSTVTTSYTYDALGNFLTVTAPGNNAATTITTTYNYTTDGTYNPPAAMGQPLTVTDNLGKVIHLRYDAQGNTLAVKDALGNETDYTYDIRNAPLQTILPATGQTGSGHGGSQVGYLYAEPSGFATAQWPIAALQYGPAATATTYDEGNVGAIRQVVSAYGPEGETLSVSGSTEPVSYAYDAVYRLKTLTDAASHVTSYFYNAAGYLSQVVYAGAQATPPTTPLTAGHADTVTFSSYDADGNALSRTDGNNATTTYAYSDPESLLTTITYPTGTIGSVILGYDNYGRRSAMSDGTGSQSYAYDDDNDLTAKTVTWTGLAAKTLSYGFYNNGSRSSMNAAGRTFAYTYDGVGRLTGLTNDNSEATGWTYLDNGWLNTKTLANGVTTTDTLDQLGRLRDLVNKTSGGTSLSDFAVPATGGYDGVGNRLSLTATLNTSYAPASYSGTTGYTYDYGSTTASARRSQVTQEASTRGGSYTNAYGYDGGTTGGPGNPTSFKGTANAFNTDNQVTNTGYGYDGNSNPTTYKASTLAFDPENRLTSYGTTQMDGYDGEGLRAWKQTGGSTTRIYFLYDDNVPVCEYDYTGTLTATNTFETDELISRRSISGSATTFYTFDERGSVVQRMTSAGSVSSTDLYDSYGSRTGTVSQPDPWGFAAQAGYYTDLEIGLLLLTHRFYDPAMGRFLTHDPINYDGGINLYGYTQNNPINKDDPTGLAVYICFRPVFKGCNFQGDDHWFIRTGCGSYGYGPKGVIVGNLPNLGDFGTPDETCLLLSATTAQEKCICNYAKRVEAGAFMCGRQWRGKPGYGFGGIGFGPTGHQPNCQDFANCLLKKCGLPTQHPTFCEGG
jgi:RHS repeat-associated protein